MDNKIDRAWCTLVMLDEAYASGAVIAAQSLRAVGSKYPIYCMVVRAPAKGKRISPKYPNRGKFTKDYAGISQECIDFMTPYFQGIIEVSFLTASTHQMRSMKQEEIYGDWINHSFTKGWILDPTKQPAHKMMFIDADMIFLKNCDMLFDLPAPAMTFSSPWAYPYHVPNPNAAAGTLRSVSRGHYNPYFNDVTKTALAHGELVPTDMIKAGLEESVVGFACMMLVEPSAKLMAEFLREIRLTTDDRNTRIASRRAGQQPNVAHSKIGYGKCISGFDEQVFAAIFLRLNVPCYNIHQRYNWIVGKDNWLAGDIDPATNEQSTPYVQQWYNGKPWNQKGWPDLVAWWKLADEVVATSDLPTIQKWFVVRK